MMRFLLALPIVLIALFFVLRGNMNEPQQELPVFLRQDIIAQNHQTKIRVNIRSMIVPDSVKVAILKQDYSNLWAHLNHLYATNDVFAGKEYYTEGWFRQMTRHYTGIQAQPIERKDLSHNLHIQNWADDDLVCSLVDSNAVFQIKYPNGTIETRTYNLAVQLLLQGDHWRIDAMRVLNEVPIP